MNIRKTVLASALMAAAFCAAAMQPMADAELSQMTGQTGISIVADMKLNIGALKYMDSTKSSSISLNTISATGLISTTVDILTGTMYTTALTDALSARGVVNTPANGSIPAGTAATTAIDAIRLATGYATGSDVLQLAFPVMPATAKGALLNVTVASINTGSSGASMGGLSVTDINMGGSKVWIHGH